MPSRFPLRRTRWLALALPIAALATLAHYATVHAQNSDQITVYSPQTTYSIPLLDVQTKRYIGLVDVLEPLGSVDARPDGKKYKLRFTPPGGRAVEAQFNDGKDKAKVLGENYKLASNFFIQNGRGYIPLSSAGEVLTKLLAKPIQLHPTARRLFIGDVPMHFTLDLDKGKLVASFPAAVNPSVASEPGHVRFTFKREPVVSNQDTYTFEDPTITGATFSERDGMAELDVKSTAPLITSFADGNKTIILAPIPPPPQVATVPAPQLQIPAQIMTPTPKPPAGPRFLVLIDPAHGGPDSGASITPSLVEKDVVLALARRVQRELQSHGIAAGLLRNSDVAITLDQRATSVNAARAALYISLHAANTGRGVHVFTSLLPAANLQRNTFLPWDTAQAAYLDLSGTVAGSVAAELENRKLPNTTLVAPLRPMNNIAAPAVAVEIAPPDDKVENIASAEYQEEVAQSIAAGVAAVRSKLPEARP
ncbi:MAG TPA: N-acetylmuramoyl-L-alanine amidase [Terriglobales bacterium]|nr:N-acetylmuramoyl-L-alanine amidase [Terriglobales bacterium]